MFLFSIRRSSRLAFRPLKCSHHLLVLVFLTFFFTPFCHAASVTLAWDPPTSNNATGYRLYRGTVSRQYTVVTTVGSQTTCQVNDLVVGTRYYFAVKAYNSYGESGYSSELAYTPPSSAANRNPVASDGSLSVTEDIPRSGTLSATDPDGNALTFSIVTPPAKGTISSLNASTGAFTYTPNANANGIDSFTFRARDASLYSETRKVSITISPVNDPPIANADKAQTYPNQAVTISVLANDTDVEGSTLSLTGATQGTRGTTAIIGTAVRYTPNVGLTITSTVTDSFKYTVSDGQASVTGNVTVTLYPNSGSGTSETLVMAINAGGGQRTAADGTVYRADVYYSGGSSRSTSSSISSTSDDTLYQTRRIGSFTYELPVSNGSYTLTLKFAEIYFSTAGQRVFDVFVEGRKIAAALDIVAKAGAAYKAYDISVPVNVQDGSVSIHFGSITSTPQLNAILLKKATQLTRLGVDSGGDRFSASDGQVYEKDAGYSGGSVSSTTAAISGTSDDTLYRSERNGNFSYSLPVFNGVYLVTLKFAEITWTEKGKRIFDVLIEGNEIISNLDIFARVGRYAAYDHVELVNVKDGELNITFRTDKDKAKVSAILVQPAY
jgi:hypothetical protein